MTISQLQHIKNAKPDEMFIEVLSQALYGLPSNDIPIIQLQQAIFEFTNLRPSTMPTEWNGHKPNTMINTWKTSEYVDFTNYAKSNDMVGMVSVIYGTDCSDMDAEEGLAVLDFLCRLFESFIVAIRHCSKSLNLKPETETELLKALERMRLLRCSE